jgi:hypothetical protein
MVQPAAEMLRRRRASAGGKTEEKARIAEARAVKAAGWQERAEQAEAQVRE